MEKCNLQLSEAGLGNSVYFFARTLGALGGGILLNIRKRSFLSIAYFWQ
jgi:hypothetical protein